MRYAVISLDQTILDSSSRSAARMRLYGEADELFIVIPGDRKATVELSPSVRVYGTGGAKWLQFIRALRLVRMFVRKEEVEWITAQDPFSTGLVGMLSRGPGTKLEVQVHGDFFNSSYYAAAGLKWKVYDFIARKFVLPKCDRIRVVGERIRSSLIALGFAAERIIVRPVKVAAEAEGPARDLREEYKGYEKIFVAIGRLDLVKNFAWLIDLMHELVSQDKKNYLLLILGEGPQKNALRQRVAELHLEAQVKFKGWASDPMPYLRSADGLLFPSLSEGYGVVVLEAIAAGCPVIMNDVGVANYEVKAGDTISILPINDRKAWKERIVSLPCRQEYI